MGTRGAWGFKINGENKLTYCHFDSYPSGLGMDLINTLTKVINDNKMDGLKEKVIKLILVNENEKPTWDLIVKYNKLSNIDVSKKTTSDWYCLLREAQSPEISIPLIEKGLLEHFLDCQDFIKDSLFCEYAYILNFDENKLELYDSCKLVGTIPIDEINKTLDLKKYYKEEE